MAIQNLNIIQKLEEKINSSFSDYTISKQQFVIPQSFNFTGGLFDGEYLFAKDNKMKFGILYRVNFNALNLLFFRYINEVDIKWGSNISIGYADEEKLQNVLTQLKTDIENIK